MNANNIVELIEKRAMDNPDNIFAEDECERITYKQLSENAKAIGKALETYDTHVFCFFIEKSVQALKYMFGVTYAGGFYVFLNTTLPDRRIKTMLEVMGANVVITNNDNINKISSIISDIQIINIDSWDIGSKECGNKLYGIRKEMSYDTLLYGTFTSGTTGIPKLVVASHGAVLDFISVLTKTVGIDKNDRLGNQAPFDYDASVKDIYSALFTGATIVIINKQLFTRQDELIKYIDEKKITVMFWAVTALCLATSSQLFSSHIYKGIRKICFSGEVMPMKFLRILMDNLPNTEFYNLYGPTEVICNCSYYLVKKSDRNSDRLSIGRAFDNRKIYLINEENEINNSYVTGEIWVGGKPLSSGYFNNDYETNKAFTVYTDSFGKTDYVYHTGDLAYFDDDGFLWFQGRRDNQIKRMGTRIELDEIENKALECTDVNLTCCVYDDLTQIICLFYVGNADKHDLRVKLRNELPAAMLPNRIIKIDEIPLNTNGKKDKKRLRNEYEQYFK